MPKHDDFMDITTILNNYSKNIYNDMQISSKKIADKGVNTLKQTSPKRTGKYSKGWSVKVEDNGYNFSSTIYNATDWRLTHLLEKPHAKRNGQMTKPKVHITTQANDKKTNSLAEEKLIKSF